MYFDPTCGLAAVHVLGGKLIANPRQGQYEIYRNFTCGLFAGCFARELHAFSKVAADKFLQWHRVQLRAKTGSFFGKKLFSKYFDRT